MPGFHHLAIQCADLATCERFYREVLGLELLRRWPRPEGGDRSVWLSVGDGFLALERAEERSVSPERSAEGAESRGEAWPLDSARPAGSQRSAWTEGGKTWKDGAPGLHLVALRIGASERAAWQERLQARGVAIVDRSRHTLYLRDPEGNRVGLSHWPDEAAEGT